MHVLLLVPVIWHLLKSFQTQVYVNIRYTYNLIFFTTEIAYFYQITCTLFQYPPRHVIGRFREVLNPRDLVLKWRYRFEIWYVPQQQCLDICQIFRAIGKLRGGMAPIMEIFFIFTLGLSYFYMISIFEKETLFQWDTFSYNQRLPW